MDEALQGLRVLIRADRPDAAICVRADGELDVSTGDVMRKALDRALEAGVGDVELELSGMTFCDSTGLCVLLTAKRDAEAVGRRLRLVDPAPSVLRLLDLSSTRCMFEVSSSAAPDGRRSHEATL